MFYMVRHCTIMRLVNILKKSKELATGCGDKKLANEIASLATTLIIITKKGKLDSKKNSLKQRLRLWWNNLMDDLFEY